MSDVLSLPNKEIANLAKFQYVIIEIPALTESQLPLHLIKEADQTILIVDAERKWKYIDSTVVNLLKKASPKPALVLLNKVSTDILVSILGEIPKVKKGNKEGKKDPVLLNKLNREEFEVK
jgi:GTPase Era involved in 16S rRNA processing